MKNLRTRVLGGETLLGCFLNLGFRFIASGSDGAMVNNAARQLATTLREKRDAR